MAKQGGNTSSVEYSPGKIKAIERTQERQEARWARMAGPVTAGQLTAEELEERQAAKPQSTSPFPPRKKT